MAFYGDDDISIMLAEWGNQITVGAVTAPCILDQSDDLGLEQPGNMAPQVKREIRALIRTTDFPGITSDSAVAIDGVDYRVLSAMAMDDGAITSLYLRADPGGGS